MERIYKIGQPNRTTTRVESNGFANGLLSSLRDMYNGLVLGVVEGKKLRSERVGSFAFKIDTTVSVANDDLTAVFDFARENNLTVAGDNSRRLGFSSSIDEIELGDTVTVGLSNAFDIDWLSAGRRLPKDVPVYSLKKDKAKIVDALIDLTKEKRKLEREIGLLGRIFRELKLEKLGSAERPKLSRKSYYTPVSVIRETMEEPIEFITVTDQFVKIGYTFIPFSRATDRIEDVVTDYFKL